MWEEKRVNGIQSHCLKAKENQKKKVFPTDLFNTNSALATEVLVLTRHPSGRELYWQRHLTVTTAGAPVQSSLRGKEDKHKKRDSGTGIFGGRLFA